jgi:hypothetical protein
MIVSIHELFKAFQVVSLNRFGVVNFTGFCSELADLIKLPHGIIVTLKKLL